MFKKAYTYMFHDNKIVQKFFTVLPFLVIFAIAAYYSEHLKPNSISYWLVYMLSMFFGMFLNGYAFNCIKSVIIQEKSENIVLPYLTLKSFITGLKFAIATFLFILVVLIPFIMVVVLPVLIMASENVALLATIGFSAVFLVCFVVFAPAIMLIFSHTERLSSFLRIPTAIKIINKSPKYFLVCLFIIINSAVVGALAYFGTGEGPALINKPVAIILLLLYFISYVYVCYANAHLIGKLLTTEEFAAIIAKKNPEENPAEISEES